MPILAGAEPEIARALGGYLANEGIALREGVKLTRIARDKEGVALEIEAEGLPEKLRTEIALVTTGRRPNSSDFGLEEAGVELLPNGGIRVDDRMRTTRSGIYAAGDGTGRDQSVYVAAHGGKVASLNALKDVAKLSCCAG